MSFAYPARCSSIELSRTSKTQWCNPRSSGSPIYMPGRLRTASNPSSLSICAALYFSVPSGIEAEVSWSISSVSLAIECADDQVEIGVQISLENCKRTAAKDNLNLHLYFGRKHNYWGTPPWPSPILCVRRQKRTKPEISAPDLDFRLEKDRF